MSMKLYVGNLAFETTGDDLKTLFAEAGTVESVSLIEDRETGRSRGLVCRKPPKRRRGGLRNSTAPSSACALLMSMRPSLAKIAMAADATNYRLTVSHHASGDLFAGAFVYPE